MKRTILFLAVSAVCLLGACATKPEAQPSTEGAETNAGDETKVVRHKREIDPEWDSAEEADEQLEGD